MIASKSYVSPGPSGEEKYAKADGRDDEGCGNRHKVLGDLRKKIWRTRSVTVAVKDKIIRNIPKSQAM